VLLICIGQPAMRALAAQLTNKQDTSSSEVDLRIVRRAADLVNSPAKWSRNDTGTCPGEAKAYSVRCALEKATSDISPEERIPMHEARELVDAIAPKKYSSRLIEFNNDPDTTFADVQAFFRFLGNRVSKQITTKPGVAANDNDDPEAEPPVTNADLLIVRKAREILSSPAKWNRADNRVCPPDAKTFSLYCALEKATDEISSQFEHRGAAMQQARFVIDEIAPNAKHYSHRLMDYNNDPGTTFQDIERFFRLLEKRIDKKLAP